MRRKKNHEVYTLGLLHKTENDRLIEAAKFTHIPSKTTATHKARTLKEAYTNRLREISNKQYPDIIENISKEKEATIENTHRLLFIEKNPQDDKKFYKYLKKENNTTKANGRTYHIINAAQYESGPLAEKAKKIFTELHENKNQQSSEKGKINFN